MNDLTLYFMEAMWNAGISQEKILNTTKKACLMEYNSSYAGLKNQDTLFISEEAKSVRAQMNMIGTQMKSARTVSELIFCQKNSEELFAKAQKLMIQSSQMIMKNGGFQIEKLHIILPAFRNLLVKKGEEYILLQSFRLLVLNGSLPANLRKNNTSRNPEEAIKYYLDYLKPALDGLTDNQLDGRWSYEKRSMILHGIRLEQYVAVPVRQSDFYVAPGNVNMGIGTNGAMRFYGRGWITNLAPAHMEKMTSLTYMVGENRLKRFGEIHNEDLNPKENLSIWMGNNNYLVSADYYFKMLNQYIIAKTMVQRINSGCCKYCGALLSHEHCDICHH